MKGFAKMGDTCITNFINTYGSLTDTLTNVCSISPSIKPEGQSEILDRIVYSPIRQFPLRQSHCPNRGWYLEFEPMAWTDYCWDCSLID
jgi:hypothetical protein